LTGPCCYVGRAMGNPERAQGEISYPTRDERSEHRVQIQKENVASPADHVE